MIILLTTPIFPQRLGVVSSISLRAGRRGPGKNAVSNLCGGRFAANKGRGQVTGSNDNSKINQQQFSYLSNFELYNFLSLIQLQVAS